jgi:hypothetical protein
MTATVHPSVHRLHVTRATLSVGWPRRVVAVFMVFIGAAFVATTIAANLFHVGPAFDRLTDGFRPVMTQHAIQTDRQDIAGLAAAGTEIQGKLLPTLAQQLNMTPAQMTALTNTRYPAVAAGLKALPTITPTMSNLVTTLDQQRAPFASADAIPTKNAPAATVPWALLTVGIVTIATGVVVWFKPRASAVIATAVGAALIAVPLVLTMPTKASNADTLNSNLKPVYTQQLITQANGAVKTLSAMGTQLQTEMLPAVATQLKVSPAQLQTLLAQNFPATAAALKDLPSSLGRFQALTATFDKHLADYKTLKPVSFEPIVWVMLIGGITLFVLGGAGIVITRTQPGTRS